MSREGEEKMDKEKKMSWQLGGSYDCKEGSSAMADGRRVRSRLSLRPSGSKMGTTMDGLLASSSSFITPFSYGFFDDVDLSLWCRPLQVFGSIRAATTNTLVVL